MTLFDRAQGVLERVLNDPRVGAARTLVLDRIRQLRSQSHAAPPATSAARDVYEFTVQTIDGKPKALDNYRGRVLLIVNVASKCGFTSQYRGLEDLHERYGAQGLSVLGFPANDFGAQEPGTNTEIQTFCTTSFGVRFDMFSKVKVIGRDLHPLFAFLTSRAGRSGPIDWNFAKFLVGHDGQLAARYAPELEPTSPVVTWAIEAALRAAKTDQT
jgi:glutathione peroxidase